MRISVALLLMTLVPGAACADEAPLQAGRYEIASRLELPHVERWAIDKRTSVCLGTPQRGAIPLPVLSDNNPFRQCVATALSFAHGRLEYDIACPGRADASAHAAYAITPGGFSGRIAMVLGAKNMTMTEVQDGRRIGDCETTAQK